MLFRSALVKNQLKEVSNFEDEDIEKFNGKFLHRDIYKEILKFNNVKIEEDGIVCQMNHYGVLVKYYFGKPGGIFPNADRAINDWDSQPTIAKDKIAFDLSSLNNLIKAMPYNTSNVEFVPKSDCVFVKSSKDSFNSIAILMTKHLEC